MVKFFRELGVSLKQNEMNDRKTSELKDNINSHLLQKQTHSSRVHFYTEILPTVSYLILTDIDKKAYSPQEQRTYSSPKLAF